MISLMALGLLTLSGCATLPSESAIRVTVSSGSTAPCTVSMTRSIEGRTPVAKAYTRVVPQPLRTGVSNFFENLGYPTTIVNDVLQAKPGPFLRIPRASS